MNGFYSERGEFGGCTFSYSRTFVVSGRFVGLKGMNSSYTSGDPSFPGIEVIYPLTTLSSQSLIISYPLSNPSINLSTTKPTSTQQVLELGYGETGAGG